MGSTRLSPAKIKKGFEVEIGPSRFILRCLGICPDPERKENLLTRLHFLVPAFVMFYFCNIPQTVIIKKVWGDLNAVLGVLTTSNIPIGIALFKLLGVWYNREILGKLVASMSRDWKIVKSSDDLETMWKNAKLSRLISITIISLAEGTIIAQFSMVMFSSYSEYKRQNVMRENATTRVRPMYMNAEFFYDIQRSPRFEITWLCQCFSTIFAASSFSAVDAFFAVLVLHLCGQLNSLKNLIRDLPKRDKAEAEDSFVRLLSSVVNRHEYLDKFATKIENAFNIMFLVQMIASSMVLCLQGYQLVMITTSGDGIPLFELVFMIYFTLCFMFSLFVYCYVADVLQTESRAVGDAAYESDWYNLAPTETKLLILIMLRAKKPFRITAGKFAEFSLRLYCSILKSSGGYLSMLLAVKDRLAGTE